MEDSNVKRVNTRFVEDHIPLADKFKIIASVAEVSDEEFARAAQLLRQHIPVRRAHVAASSSGGKSQQRISEIFSSSGDAVEFRRNVTA